MASAQYNSRDRALLSQRISELGETEHNEILKILQRHGVSQTSNRNGIFVNLSSVPDSVIDEMSSFVTYCISNKVQLDEYDKRMNECKIRQEYNDLMMKKRPKEEEEDASATAGAPPEDQESDPALEAWMNLDKRNDNVKYCQAKKKFSKRRVDNVKDTGDAEELRPEPYVMV